MESHLSLCLPMPCYKFNSDLSKNKSLYIEQLKKHILSDVCSKSGLPVKMNLEE